MQIKCRLVWLLPLLQLCLLTKKVRFGMDAADLPKKFARKVHWQSFRVATSGIYSTQNTVDLVANLGDTRLWRQVFTTHTSKRVPETMFCNLRVRDD